MVNHVGHQVEMKRRDNRGRVAGHLGVTSGPFGVSVRGLLSEDARPPRRVRRLGESHQLRELICQVVLACAGDG